MAKQNDKAAADKAAAPKEKTYTQAELDNAVAEARKGFDTELATSLAKQKDLLEKEHEAKITEAVKKAVEGVETKGDGKEESLEVLKQKVAKLEAKEAVKAKAVAAKLAAKQKANRPTFKHSSGVQYAFKLNAPKTLNVDGKPQAISELIKNKEIMTELIAGNSNFVERI